ncbi:MAG: CdaR family protein [Armatimonadetes bacterium]|nr:CdaR family protein [Armatimonadota bacterium]
MIRHNLGYKLMALVVALALWSFVNAERNPQISKPIPVPIMVNNEAENYVAELDVRDAIVTVQGSKSAVDEIGSEDLSVTADLTGIGEWREGTQAVSVQARLKKPNASLDIIVNPKTVNVKLEMKDNKRLPVEFASVPPLGYAYNNLAITPANVTIRGRMSEVSRVKKVVFIGPIPTGSIDGSFSIQPVDLRGVPVTGVELIPQKVHVKVDLVEVPASKKVIVSPDISGMPQFPAKITKVTVTPLMVTLQGRPAALVNVTTIDTERIYVNDATGTITQDVDLRLPYGVTTAERGKVRVTVYITSPAP